MVAAGKHGISHPLEMVETVLEVADVAWNAYEHHRRRGHQQHPPSPTAKGSLAGAAEGEACAGEKRQGEDEKEDVLQIQEENRRLRAALEQNLSLLRGLSKSAELSTDCPADLYSRLVSAVDSSSFLIQHDTLHLIHTGENLKPEDLLDVTDDPSCWVWVTKEMHPAKTEETSGIDNENYIIISEEDVVDGIANFIAYCIVANPKSKKLTPEELQKIVLKSLGGMKDWHMLKKVWHAAKLFYGLSTWGIALYGLYRHPAIVKAVAKGVTTTGKFVIKAL